MRRPLPAGLPLGNYLAAHSISFDAMAEQCGIGKTSIRRIAAGTRPSFLEAMKIERATNGIVNRMSWQPPYKMPQQRREAPTPQTETN